MLQIQSSSPTRRLRCERLPPFPCWQSNDRHSHNGYLCSQVASQQHPRYRLHISPARCRIVPFRHSRYQPECFPSSFRLRIFTKSHQHRQHFVMILPVIADIVCDAFWQHRYMQLSVNSDIAIVINMKRSIACEPDFRSIVL